ncbi:MAG: fibronectin type III domain-containing protein, partial [Nitrospiria bacterium]
DGAFESPNSNDASAVPINDPPAAPTGLVAADAPGDAGGTISLSWTLSTSPDVLQQRIYRSTTGGGPYSLAATIPGNTINGYIDSGLTDGTTYYYVIRAYDGFNESANSNESSAIPFNDPPTAPRNLTAVHTAGTQSITLDWIPSASTDVAEQRIYRSTTTGGPYSLLTTLPDNTTNRYIDTGLIDGTTYYYVVRAYDGATESVDSNEAFATVDNTPPTVPADLILTPQCPPGAPEYQILLTWTASTDNVGVVGYKIYRNSTVVPLTGIENVISYLDRGLFPDTLYNYAVSAFDASGNESAPSTRLGARTCKDTNPPTVPTNLAANPVSSSQISLTWSPSTDDDVVNSSNKGYKIYRNGVLRKMQISPITFYLDTELTPETIYAYQVAAFDFARNESALSAAVLAATFPENQLPFPPTNLTAADTPNDAGGSITLHWTPSTFPGVTEQRIYRSTTGGGPYSLVAQIPNNTTNRYVDTGLSNGTPYYYVIRAYDGASESINSNEASAIPVNDPPAAPSNLQAADTPNDLGGSITLIWTVSISADVVEQRLYRSLASGGPYTLIATLTNNTTNTYTDTGLTNGLRYFYVLRANDGDQESLNSNEASAIPLDNDAPLPPTNLTAVDTPNDDGGSITLNWTPSASTDVTEQRIYRSTTSGGPYFLVATGFNNTLNSYVDIGLINGTRYYYVIRAYDGFNESSNSNEASAIPLDNNVPNAPTNLTAMDTPNDQGGSITLNWVVSTSPDVTQQRVYRGLISGGPYNLIATFLNNTTNTYTDSGLTNDIPYYYVVRAYDGTQESPNSNEAFAIPLDNIGPTVSITSPTPGANVRGSITIDAIATDAGSGVARVDFFDWGA